jgi:Ca2+-binding RTX toxin-like protein
LVSKLRLEDVIMLEILILSILGFAGTAIGGLVTSDDEGNAAVDEEDAGSDAADDLSGDLLLETLETEIPIDPVVGEQVGVDVLIGSDQDDVLTDWTGSNEMYGGDGDDTLQGGFDVGELSELHGDAGNDVITDGASDAIIFGGEGDDSIVSGHGVSDIYGGAGDDAISTGIDTDVIHGDAGNDTITAIGTDTEGEVYGGEGDDTLQIRGATEAYGGEGADTFTGYFNTWVDEAPTVLDYNAAEDQLEVDIYAHEGVQELDDFDINVQDFEDGSGASIYVDGIEVMRIPGAQGLDLADVQLNLV